MNQIRNCLKPYKKYIFYAVLFMLLDVVAEIMQPLLMAQIIGKGILLGDVSFILKIGLSMILLALVSIAAGIGNSKYSAKSGVGFAAELRQTLFKKVQSFSFRNIDTFSTASLSTRLTNDVTLLQNTVITGMRILIRAPLMLLFSIIMAVRLSVSLSIVLAVIVPILLVFVAIMVHYAMPRFKLMQKRVDILNQNIQENVTNVRVVKSFVRGAYEKEKFRDSNTNLMKASLHAMNLVIISMPMMMLLMNTSIVSIVWIGGTRIINGYMDVATMSAFINYIMMILMSLIMISMMFILFTRASASYQRIREVLDAEVDLTDHYDETHSDVIQQEVEEKIKGDVAFEHVSFSYDLKGQGDEILSDINFSAKQGEVIAIIGSTGAGKSSFVQLIPRLYDVTAGNVLIDGKDVREYNLHTLRSQIGMVLQKNTLFSGTIRDNLKWGDPNATDEEVILAAKNAQAHGFIMSFPKGYDTWIDQGGVNVSGGQKQRLCIARAMLKKPAILILDDSTSAVDTATEAKIRESFHESLKETTTFLIAQRISSVQDADKIIVLDEGKILDIGTHDQLLKRCQTYQEIYESQAGKEASA
ncbi:ABC transporter ATP-binding protein [Sinanaerobacter sp. ZZT-01]|uniref:ABC transporter ATP-binding protein n=1 Tax=Sinanaerobacter sp. ZZT-01 TaxID=3111540 RepID=UPI002D783CED|nr:ABC transporter ATP-binding protein [Sinanaerobacter sp. ZZT-01]WRR92418.1 ABC transporter ATP-binding protein [Sinanaerobacter sp. ZZT-01]